MKQVHFLQTRGGRVLTGIGAFVAVWLVFLRASHTGSLQQYGILILLIIFGFNRLITAVWFKPNK